MSIHVYISIYTCTCYVYFGFFPDLLESKFRKEAMENNQKDIALLCRRGDGVVASRALGGGGYRASCSLVSSGSQKRFHEGSDR